MYECDPFGLRPAQPRPALGRFEHEAVAVDPDRGHLFLTEDVPDGGFYRFRPMNGLPDLTSGRLEIAQIVAGNGRSFVVWHRIEDPAAETAPTRRQVPEYTPFDGSEGVDNVTITASGDLLVAEDGGDMQLVAVGPSGQVIPVVQVIGQDESEICGPAFTPAFDRLYFSFQTGPKNRRRDGITYEISHA